jgi:hypothetical protein
MKLNTVIFFAMKVRLTELCNAVTVSDILRIYMPINCDKTSERLSV